METGSHWFIENYGFPFVAAWDGFHVYSGQKLKKFQFSKSGIPFQI